MGKPPRERIRVAAVSGITHSPNDQTHTFDRNIIGDVACGNGEAATIGDSLAIDPEPHSAINSTPLSWSLFDDYAANCLTVGDAVDSSSFGLPGLLPPDLMSADFAHDLFRDYNPPDKGGYSIPSTQARTSPPLINDNSGPDKALLAPSPISSHDCSREAHGILINLSSPRSDAAQVLSQPACAQPNLNVGSTHQIPVDQILRLNREATDRLGLLLTCSCSQRPHLALLYASIMSLVLTHYQQAAGCSQTDPVKDTASHPVSSPGSLSGLVSPWSNTRARSVDERSYGHAPITGSMAIDSGPAQMTMGSFRVDDQGVRAALTVQLVLGEIKRVGHLIDLLTSRSLNGFDEIPADGINTLYRNLAYWFRREHSKIVESLKSRLEEVTS